MYLFICSAFYTVGPVLCIIGSLPLYQSRVLLVFASSCVYKGPSADSLFITSILMQCSFLHQHYGFSHFPLEVQKKPQEVVFERLNKQNSTARFIMFLSGLSKKVTDVEKEPV